MHDFKKERRTWFIFVGVLIVTIITILASQTAASASPDCDLYPDASWCTGPSMKECPQGIEVPEDWDCNFMYTNDTDALGDPNDPFTYEQTTREGSCESDGTCDDSCSPPARGDCLEGEFDWLECQDGSEPNEYHMCPVPNFERAHVVTTSDSTIEPIEELPATGWPVTLLITGILFTCIGTMLIVKSTK